MCWFPESPLKVPWRSRTLRPLGDLQGTSAEHHVPEHQGVDQNKDGEDVPKLESVEVVLVHCNLFNNNYQQASEILFPLVPNKQFGQLITITPHSPTMLKTTNAELQSIEVWFTNQNNRPLETENNVNIILKIGTG